MSVVKLRQYDNSWYQPGRSVIWRSAWLFLGLPILRCSLLPSSSIRVALLRLFGARIGDRVVMRHSVNVKYPWHLEIGQDCWIGEECWIDNLTTVQIGSDVCLSQGCYLCTGNHDWSDPAFGLIVKPIHIRNGVWVGARAFLAPGVVLGEGAVAAACSVITRDIPSFEVHAGNPAAFIKSRRLTPRPANLATVECMP
jgi:putative colanic acid biosynthesis acetyltransferase WcaF